MAERDIYQTEGENELHTLLAERGYTSRGMDGVVTHAAWCELTADPPAPWSGWHERKVCLGSYMAPLAFDSTHHLILWAADNGQDTFSSFYLTGFVAQDVENSTGSHNLQKALQQPEAQFLLIALNDFLTLDTDRPLAEVCASVYAQRHPSRTAPANDQPARRTDTAGSHKPLAIILSLVAG